MKVDARGEQCPIPVIKTKKAIQELGGKGTVEVLVDNEIAVQNVTKMGQSQGAKVTSEKLGEKEFRLQLELTGEGTQTGKDSAGEQEAVSCIPDSVSKDQIVVVSSALMGTGNEELGKVLMKGFLYAVSQLEQLPKTILFYNGGATLTTEGSDSLEDLKSMEAQGVEILTCGTCLDYYGLKEKLKVGGVTNMYTIVETMAQAGSVIRP